MATGDAPSNDQFRGRFWNHPIRRASYISPLTGERVKRAFTLQDASNGAESNASEVTPLLLNGRVRREEPVVQGVLQRCIRVVRTFAASKTGSGILKCSLAYLLGSLATFIPFIARLIGERQDSKHLVATVTVWFHPARSIGSMHEATALTFIAFCYAGIVSFTSMGISMFFGLRGLLIVGHTVVLVVFIGGGLGLVAWVKQHLGHPLVNVACSLASIGCITVMIKEGSVQAGEFSNDKVAQVLLMVIMGVTATTAINMLVFPVFARNQLVKDMERHTDLLGDMLISITQAFLSGRQGDLHDNYFQGLTSEHDASSAVMTKDLGEAKRELFLLGREHQWKREARIVECLIGMSQDLGGLRSAAFAQFAMLQGLEAPTAHESSRPPTRQLQVIAESPHETEDENSGLRKGSIVSNCPKSPSGLFYAFLEELAPPTKSLVFMIKQILDELPFRKNDSSRATFRHWWRNADVEVAVNKNFHSSLKRAIDLYKQSRTEALENLYRGRAPSAILNSAQDGNSIRVPGEGNLTVRRRSLSGQFTPRRGSFNPAPESAKANMEEVSACCGHFSFSLLDFAEEVLSFLSALEDLRDVVESPRRTWSWLISYRRSPPSESTSPQAEHEATLSVGQTASESLKSLPTRLERLRSYDFEGETKTWSHNIRHLARFFGRDDVKFAIKVGLGAMLYALPAFIPRTRPIFSKWRGEWGLVSYMVVCSMTVGASNTTSFQRFLGTFVGAFLSIVGWLAAHHNGDANPWILGLFGWLVSIGCFYIILAKNNGPLGRFIMLTYNLVALYSYSLSVQDGDNDDDEGGIDPAIWEIVAHRVVAVVVGCIWAIIITRIIWPISARRKLRDGLSVLWLRMGLIWKRDPLAMLLQGEPSCRYMDIREESSLRSSLLNLQTLRKAANSEYGLSGAFPDNRIRRILTITGRMLDAFHVINIVISKNLAYTPGEAAVLRYTRKERAALSARISHLFFVLASSLKLKYPLSDVLPSIDHTRERLLTKVSEFRHAAEWRDEATEQDYELLYAYVLVTGQLAEDIRSVSIEIETLYGALNEDSFKLE
ncbi:hypothetical protein K470DRAFT_234366 [Piedraia hortae CBS 480.64]|uniref:Integral membrane bound transporter domain-containing protein n=1 Tax=Piedraia hortae CBS 480.64 TaxID=1314780 RepID=A0A6A7BWC8_9PEZI|nr:hypothetical protein K470DRAFT_234366 [Piedraia hortae CBS 480.64]